MDNLGIVISNASSGRALRGLRISAMDSQEVAPKLARNNVNNEEAIPFVSIHILLGVPQGEEQPMVMAPAQPSKSFIACFSTSEDSLKFREDVESKGWSAALSLHGRADFLKFFIDLNANVILILIKPPLITYLILNTMHRLVKDILGIVIGNGRARF